MWASDFSDSYGYKKNKRVEEAAKFALDGLHLHMFRVGGQGRIHIDTTTPTPPHKLMTPYPLAKLLSTHIQTQLFLFSAPCS